MNDHKLIRLHVARSLLAGIYIGFGCLGMVLVRSCTVIPPMLSNFLSGIIFSIGLYLVFSCKGMLYTGLVYRVTDVMRDSKKFPLKNYIAVMIPTLIFNFLGIALVAVFAEELNFYPDVARMIASTKFVQPPHMMFLRAMFCNVLIVLAVFCNMRSTGQADTYISALLPVMLFVACGFEHCVADMFFVRFVNFDILSVWTVVLNMLIAVIGNTFGGVLISALLYVASSDEYESKC